MKWPCPCARVGQLGSREAVELAEGVEHADESGAHDEEPETLRSHGENGCARTEDSQHGPANEACSPGDVLHQHGGRYRSQSRTEHDREQRQSGHRFVGSELSADQAGHTQLHGVGRHEQRKPADQDEKATPAIVHHAITPARYSHSTLVRGSCSCRRAKLSRCSTTVKNARLGNDDPPRGAGDVPLPLRACMSESRR